MSHTTVYIRVSHTKPGCQRKGVLVYADTLLVAIPLVITSP